MCPWPELRVRIEIREPGYPDHGCSPQEFTGVAKTELLLGDAH